MKGTTALEIWLLVTRTVSAAALPLSLTLSVFEPAVALTDSVPASPLRLPVFVGALLDTLIVSPAPLVMVVVPLADGALHVDDVGNAGAGRDIDAAAKRAGRRVVES